MNIEIFGESYNSLVGQDVEIITGILSRRGRVIKVDEKSITISTLEWGIQRIGLEYIDEVIIKFNEREWNEKNKK